MLKLLKFNYKELLFNKVTLWYIIIYCLFCSIVVPIVFKDMFVAIIIALNFAFVVQIGPNLFVKEKENATLETIISAPVSMKKIFMGKVCYCFTVVLAMLYISYIGAILVNLVIKNNDFMGLQLKQVVIYFLFIPLSLIVESFHATFLSLKSNDSRACALKLIFVTALYSILPISIFSSFKLDPIIVPIMITINLLLNLIIFSILWKRVKIYFNKSIVLTMLSKVV